MEQYMEHTLPASWSEMNKGPWGFGEGGSRLSNMMECASVSEHTSNPLPGSYIQVPRQQDKVHGNKTMPYPFEDTLNSSSLPPQLLQETYDAMRGVTAWVPGLQEPVLSKEYQHLAHPSAGANSSVSHNEPPFTRSSGRDRSSSTQTNPPQTWCQSYINGPRARTSQEGLSADTGSSGEGAQDEVDVRSGSHNVHFSGNTGDVHAGPSQLIHTNGQQVPHQMQGGQPVFVPLFGTHTGIAQPQGAAAVVAGTARPRVRARRGQATDPHSIAERLRRERIAERMKALQELVPNANKTDKASMLDEIIDYVKFLQLQVKVLSMSRLGGAGTVAPLIADFPAEGQNNLAAALGSANNVQDGMVVAERQVARLMEEDMGSAMQFLQAKGLCLMPVSLATVISSNNSRMMMGGGGQQGFSAVDHLRIHAASSTSSTLASAASSGCIGGEGDSKNKQQRDHPIDSSKSYSM